MKKRNTILYIFILIFNIVSSLSFLAGCSNSLSGNRPLAKNGIIDLSRWDFDKDGPVNLEGEYEFYWKQFLMPDDFTGDSVYHRPDFIHVPSLWTEYNSENTKFSVYGYGTYRLQIIIPENYIKTVMSLDIKEIKTASRVFINGKEASSAGKPGISKQDMKLELKTQLVDFYTTEKKIDIIVHVSNFQDRDAGIANPIYIGTSNLIHKRNQAHIALEMTIFGILLITALYHFSLFLMRRNDLSNLHYSIFCFLFSIKTICDGEKYILDIFTGLSSQLYLKIWFISIYIAIPFFMFFMYTFLPGFFRKSIVYLYAAAGFITSLIVAFFPLHIYIYTLTPYLALTLIIIIYITSGIVSAAIQGVKESYPILIGSAIFFIISINDILHNMRILDLGFLNNPYMSRLGFVALIFSYSYVISMRFSDAFKIVSRQRKTLNLTNQELMKEIDERTLTENRLKIYENIVSSSGEQILYVDKNYDILAANNRSFFINTQTHNSNTSVSLKSAAGKENFNLFKDMIDKCFEGHSIRQEEWVYIDNIGKCYFNISYYPHRENKKSVDGVIIIINDITERIQIEQKLLEVSENERSKISMELHDGISHRLLGLAIKCKMSSDSAMIFDSDLSKEIAEIEKAINEIIEDTRNIAKGLSPIESLINTKISDIIGEIASSLSNRYNLDIAIDISDEITINNHNQLRNLYYIIDEAFVNAYLHGKADEITIKISNKNSIASISISDNGSGRIENFNQQSGIGISNISRRIRMLGGRMSYQNLEPEGILLMLELPAE